MKTPGRISKEDIITVPIGFKDLSISREEIARSLGYSDGEMPVHFQDLIGDILEQVPERCELQACYRILDIEKREHRTDELSIGGEFFKVQKIVAGHLRKAEKALIFVCSIGPAMETWAKKISAEGDILASHLVDAAASVTVELTADVLHDRIENHMHRDGMKITNRYSPGYCDWPVSEQHLLFSFLPEKVCGISLSDSALMIPIKSISGIIGAGKAVKRVEYACAACGMKDCTYRAFRVAHNNQFVHQS